MALLEEAAQAKGRGLLNHPRLIVARFEGHQRSAGQPRLTSSTGAEDVEISGKPIRVKVAYVRLRVSWAMYVRVYLRETQEMLFDAHAQAFALFGGAPTRGIYDNMKTAVNRAGFAGGSNS